MQIELNEFSDDYKVIRYPGGELQVRLMGDALARLKKLAEGPWEVDIIARIRSSEDIIILSLLALFTGLIRDCASTCIFHISPTPERIAASSQETASGLKLLRPSLMP
jgi:hypothetical protein